jgi:hypothetical protein
MLRPLSKRIRSVCTYVVASEVVDIGLAEHSIVLELRLSQRRGVAGDD